VIELVLAVVVWLFCAGAAYVWCEKHRPVVDDDDGALYLIWWPLAVGACAMLLFLRRKAQNTPSTPSPVSEVANAPNAAVRGTQGPRTGDCGGGE
jgi:hypothetical protein